MGSGRTARLQSNLFQGGYDKVLGTPDGVMYWGAAVDYADGKTVYERGNGTNKSVSVALYNSYVGDDGHYYDLVLRQGHYYTTYGLTDLSGTHSSADYGTLGTTLSGEYGYRKALRDGAYVEPQIELILGHIGSADYVTSQGWPVYVSGTNHIITRVGLAGGIRGDRGGAYAKMSIYHDFAGSTAVDFGSGHYERDGAKTWLAFTLGGDYKLGKNTRLYGECTKYAGDISNKMNFNAGIRFTF